MQSPDDDFDQKLIDCLRYISLFLQWLQFTLFIAHAVIIRNFFSSFEVAHDQESYNLNMRNNYPQFLVSIQAEQIIDGIMASVLFFTFIALYYKKKRIFLAAVVINILIYIIWFIIILYWLIAFIDFHEYLKQNFEEKIAKYKPYYYNFCRLDVWHTENQMNMNPKQTCDMQNYYISLYKISIVICGISPLLYIENIILGRMYLYQVRDAIRSNIPIQEQKVILKTTPSTKLFDVSNINQIYDTEQQQNNDFSVSRINISDRQAFDISHRQIEQQQQQQKDEQFLQQYQSAKNQILDFLEKERPGLALENDESILPSYLHISPNKLDYNKKYQNINKGEGIALNIDDESILPELFASPDKPEKNVKYIDASFCDDKL